MPRTVIYDTPIVQAELQVTETTRGRKPTGPTRGRKPTGPTAADRRDAYKTGPTAPAEAAAIEKPLKDDYASKLAKYVPGEVVAVSLAGFAAFGPTGNWVWFALGLGLAANFIYLAQLAAGLSLASRPRPYFYVLSSVAFVFWAAATIPQVRGKFGLDGEVNADKAAYLLFAAAFTIPALDTILNDWEMQERP